MLPRFLSFVQVHSLYESRPWRGEIVHSPIEPSAPTLPRVPTPPLLPKAARYIPASAKRGPVGGFNGREMKPRKPRNDSAREILSKIERLRRNEQEFLAFQEEVQIMIKDRWDFLLLPSSLFLFHLQLMIKARWEC